MSAIELVLVAFGLSMDAFAVAVCKGLSMKQITLQKCIIIGIYFGVFQGIMPLAGYFLGGQFEYVIREYDHWIIFILLSIIGGSMLKESFEKEEEQSENDASISFRVMFPLAIATSIDAMAVGVSLAFLKVSIISSAIIIGTITFFCSMAGVKIGNIFGMKYKAGAERMGGIILIFIGIKILAEHLGLIIL